jgi:hypothetical protein
MSDSTFDIESLKKQVNDLQAYIGFGGAKPVSDKTAAPAPTPALGTAENPAPLKNIPTPTQMQPPVNNSMQGQMPSTELVKLQQTDTTSGLAEGNDKIDLYNSAVDQYNQNADFAARIEEQGIATNKANEQADTQLGSMKDKATEYASIVENNRKELQNDLRELDTQIQKVKDTQFKDFWADKSTPGKLAMAIAVGVGQYASTMTGTQNMSWNILQKAMDDDFRLQQANFDRQLKAIDMLKVGMDAKQKYVDAATKSFEVYKIARGAYVEDLINKEMAKTGSKMPLALEEAYNKVVNAQNAAYQSALNNTIDKKVTQVSSGIRQSQITPELAEKMSVDPKTAIGKYNKAMDNYEQVQNFKGSKNYNATVIKLVASELEQGSYDTAKFDTTTRSVLEKLRDKGIKAFGDGEEQIIVQAAEKYFEEAAKSAYNGVKDQLPMFKSLSLQHTAGQNSNLYSRNLSKDLLNKTKNLGELGTKKVGD